MIRSFLAALAILVVTLIVTSQAGANNAAESEEAEEAQPTDANQGTQVNGVKTASAEKARVIYVPPRRGSPRAKTPGGVRGFRQEKTIPHALAPSHVAFTQSASPTLYFHVDRIAPSGGSIVLTVIAEDRIDPDLEIRVEPNTYPGFGRVRLADHGVELRKDIEYEWSVTVQLDAENPSFDPIDQGWIRRVDPLGDLDPATASAGDFAGRGLWYEALDHAFGKTSTPNADVRSLLEQIDLSLAR